jgi:demethylmenaquinone methyltransferase/2-methoxy-6-polyprenyl-1,4-benzoquinol methylase
MRDVTRARLVKAGLADRVELHLGDAARLPFEANSVDAVFTSFTLELFDTPEIPIVLQQCRHVLRDGGRICVVAMSKEGSESAARRFYEWGHARFPGYIDCRPIYVRKALEEAGFQIADITTMPYWGLPVEIILGMK